MYYRDIGIKGIEIVRFVKVSTPRHKLNDFQGISVAERRVDVAGFINDCFVEFDDDTLLVEAQFGEQLVHRKRLLKGAGFAVDSQVYLGSPGGRSRSNSRILLACMCAAMPTFGAIKPQPGCAALTPSPIR